MKYNAYNSASFNSAVFANPREVKFKVVHNNTTTYTQENIKSFKIDSTPVNGKWFGISYSQQLDVIFIDPTKSITIARGDTLKVSLIVGNTVVDYPTYYVDNSVRDEKTGDLSATGFDIMAKANNIMFTVPSDFDTTYPNGATYTDLCNLAGSALGCNVALVGNTSLKPTVNGTTDFKWTKDKINIGESGITLREFIIDLAEVSGRFAYINSNDYLLFRGISGGSNTTSATVNFKGGFSQKIDKTKYFELTTDNAVVLSGISHTNELNDTITVTAGTDTGGTHQILYDNVFLSLLDDTDIQGILNNIYTEIKKTYYPYQLTWRGSPALEIGDTLWIATKDCTIPVEQWTSSTPGILRDCYYLSETLEYNGGLRGTCEWQWDSSQNVENVTPTNVSANSRTTRAIVDKQNGKIELLVAEIEGPTGIGSRLTITENNISTIVGDWGPTGTHTKIEQNAESISSIAQTMGPTGTFWSRIEQDAHDVAITATEEKMVEVMGPTGSWAGEIPLLGPTGTITAMQSDISSLQVGATGITTSVSQIVTALGPTGSWPSGIGTDTLFGNSGIIYNLNSEINQTAGEINTLVQAVGPTGGKVYSQISQTASDITAEVYGPTGVASIFATANAQGSQIKLKADQIEMTGSTTFLSAGDVGPTGSTNIDGGRITTGTISANRIDTTNLYVQNIGSTGWTPGAGQAVNVAGNMYFRDDYSGNLISWEVDDGANVIRNLGLGSYDTPNGIVIGRQSPNSAVFGASDYDAKLGATYFSSGIWVDAPVYGSSFPSGAQAEGRLFFLLSN